MDKKYLDFLGITKWHEAGFKGQNINIMSEEKINAFLPEFENVICPFTYNKESGHGDITMSILHEVAPQATFYSMCINGTEQNGIFKSEQIDYIKANNIDIITTSSLGTGLNGVGARKELKELVDNDIVLCCSAGNRGSSGLDKMATNEEWLAIGGCHYNCGKPKRANYSAIGEEIDYTSLMGGYEGTSFSAPMFAGMLGLVQCFFLKKTGKQLKYKSLIQFVSDNCMDLYEEGHDDKTGNGLFILPDIDNINVDKYVCNNDSEDNIMTEIYLKIGSKEARVSKDNVISTIQLDTQPIIENGRTLVPLRFIAEAMEMKVEFDNETKEIKIIKK